MHTAGIGGCVVNLPLVQSLVSLSQGAGGWRMWRWNDGVAVPGAWTHVVSIQRDTGATPARR